MPADLNPLSNGIRCSCFWILRPPYAKLLANAILSKAREALSEPPSRPWHKPPLSWLFSIQLGISLLTIVSVASVAGTLIKELPRAQELVYYSVWYRTLLLLLALNIGFATWRTIVEKVLPTRRQALQDSPRFYDGITPTATYATTSTAAQVAEAFRAEGFSVRAEGGLGHAAKGQLGRWGAPVSHIGFVMVLLGGFFSAWTAREGTVRIGEGEAADSMVVWSPEPREEPLGFIVHVDDYDMDYFPNTRPPIPSSFVSTVSIFSLDGEIQASQPVEVNRSLKIHGWTFHQSNYDQNPQAQRLVLDLGVDRTPQAVPMPEDPSLFLRQDERATTITMEISPGQTRSLPDLSGHDMMLFSLSNASPRRWTIVSRDGRFSGALSREAGGLLASDIVLRADQFEPDLVIGEGGRIASRSQELNNPALAVTVFQGGQPVARPWLFAREDSKKMMHQESGPVELELLEVRGAAADQEFVVAARSAGADTTVVLRLNEETSLAAPPATAPAQSQPVDEAAAAGPWRVRVIGRAPAYYTILTLTRNASIPFIYLGCAVMMLGLLMAFLISRREVWFALDPSSGSLRVAAIYRQPQEEFDASVRRAIKRLGASSDRTGS